MLVGLYYVMLIGCAGIARAYIVQLFCPQCFVGYRHNYTVFLSLITSTNSTSNEAHM